MRCTLLAFCALMANLSLAQDWQTHYQSSRAAFENKNYLEAITSAEKSLQQVPSSDNKSRAYVLQLITAASIEGEVASRGIAYSDQEIDAFNTLDPNGKNYLEALKKKAQLLLMNGKPADAAKHFRLVSEARQKIGDVNSLEYWKSVIHEADAWLQAADYRTANTQYEKALPSIRQLPDAGEDYLYGLYNYCFSLVQVKDHARAATSLEEFISLVERNNLKDLPEYEEARKMLSRLNVLSGTAGTGKFLTAEDQLKNLLSSAIAHQATDPKKSIADYEAGEKLIVENKFLNNTSFSCYLNYARFLYSQERIDDATAKAVLASEQATKLFSENEQERGYLSGLLADLALKKGKAAEAITLYQQSDRIFSNKSKDEWLKNLHRAGNQLMTNGAAQDAAQWVSQAFEKPVFSTLTEREQIGLYRLAATALIDARQQKALIALLQKKLGNAQSVSLKQTYHLFNAQAEKEEGNLSQALRTLKEAEKVKADAGLEAEIYYEMARLHQQLGEFKEAELAYRDAVREISKSPVQKYLILQLSNSFATFYIQLGNYAEAEKLFKELLKGDDSRSVFYNSVRQNLAAMYQQTGRYSDAKKLLSAAVKADKEILGATSPEYAISLQNLASVYLKTGQLDSSMLLYRTALEIDRNTFGEQSLSYATKLANLAAVYQEQENYDQARQLFEKALAIRRGALHSEHPDYAYNLYNLGYLFYRTNQSDKAYPYFKESTDYYLRQIKDVFPVLSDYERTAFYNRMQPVIRNYESFMLEYVGKKPSLAGEFLNFRLETKALLLGASLKVRMQILSSGDKDLISKFALWQHTKEQLAYLYSLTSAERERNKHLIEEYKAKSNELEKWLSLQSTPFGNAVGSSSIDWKNVRASLKAGEAAVEIIRVQLPKDSVVYAALLVTSGADQPKLVIMEEGRKLDTRFFRGYINSIRFQIEDMSSYNAFWKKIDNALPGVKAIYLSADGVYNKINPLTFYKPESKTYLVDDLQLQLCTNLKEIVSGKNNVAHSSSALLLGFPDYRLDATVKMADLSDKTRSAGNVFVDVLKNGVADLPGTGDEVTLINQALGGAAFKTTVFTRDKASEDVIKRSKEIELLHIATHGFFIAPGKDNAEQVHGNDLSNAENNVMLRSGLLLAGAEKNMLNRLTGKNESVSDDGILTAFEVMNLNLDNTSLVVLSACETGSGDVRNGEGVYGLQRAFMLAGAKSVVMSLWKVDDQATQYLMTEFYKAWTSGRDRSHAFYHTQKEVRKKYAHPYYWGAFVVTGNM